MASHRHDRAASTLRREISRILAQEIADPDLSALYVSSVSLAPDKRSAKVLIAPPEASDGGEPDPALLRALERATPAIRTALGKSLRMRRVPELRFAFDLSERHAQRIDSLLERIKKRSMKGLTVLLCAFAVPFAHPVRASADLERMESSARIMGSEFRIACYAPSKQRAAGAITAAFDEVRRVDGFLSHYKPDSELSRVNRDAANRTVPISAEFAEPTTLNFLPGDHLVVLAAERVLAGMEEVWARLRGARDTMPRTVNLITGPSKTADVEQILQEGAHGPRRLHLLLIDAPGAGSAPA